MGHDQILHIYFGLDQVLSILKDPIILKSIRLANLSLMRKRPCFNSDHHCIDMAREVI